MLDRHDRRRHAWCRASAPRPLVTIGMLLGGGRRWSTFTGITPDSSYASHVLPGLLMMGLGLGLGDGAGDEHRDRRRRAADAGVASAMVNTGQQIGGSIGTALLSTLAASAATLVRGRQGAARRR